MQELVQPPVFRDYTGHEAQARPMCATCFRHFQPHTSAPCRTLRPCVVAKCENDAAFWVIDTE